MVKVSEFIIAIIFSSFIIAVFGLYMSNMASNYGVTYDNSSLDAYNQLEEMSSLAEEIEAGSEIEEKSGILDVIGGYFSDAYNVLKLTKTSFNTFDSMSNQAIQDANLGQAGEWLRIAVSATILILIVLAVIISAIVKWAL